MAIVKVYGTGNCPYCRQAKALLNAIDVPFEDIRIDLDNAALREFAQVTNGARTVPQILIDGKCIGGYAELSSLHRDGALTQLLGK